MVTPYSCRERGKNLGTRVSSASQREAYPIEGDSPWLAHAPAERIAGSDRRARRPPKRTDGEAARGRVTKGSITPTASEAPWAGKGLSWSRNMRAPAWTTTMGKRPGPAALTSRQGGIGSIPVLKPARRGFQRTDQPPLTVSGPAKVGPRAAMVQPAPPQRPLRTVARRPRAVDRAAPARTGQPRSRTRTPLRHLSTPIGHGRAGQRPAVPAGRDKRSSSSGSNSSVRKSCGLRPEELSAYRRVTGW